MGTVSLKNLFPDIFVLAQHQEKSVAEMWSPQGWNMIFRRILFDWEIPIMIELFKLLESFQGIQPGKDYLWWHGHNKGIYRVKDGCKQTSLRENQDFKWPWKRILRAKVPQKV